jgi:rRNA biogenesis protein RRP5
MGVQAMLKKFKYSKKVWMRYHDLVLGQGDGARAAELLKRSLQSLAKHKHVAVISHFAQVRPPHKCGDETRNESRLHGG